MKKTLLATITLVCLGFGQIQADPVTIVISGAANSANDGAWEISTIGTGTFADNQGLLQAQVWWDNPVLALLFATTLGNGLPNSVDPDFGPVFQYGLPSASVFNSYFIFQNTIVAGVIGPDTATTWAIAQRPTSVPEPGSLALFAMGLISLALVRRRTHLRPDW